MTSQKVNYAIIMLDNVTKNITDPLYHMLYNGISKDELETFMETGFILNPDVSYIEALVLNFKKYREICGGLCVRLENRNMYVKRIINLLTILYDYGLRLKPVYCKTVGRTLDSDRAGLHYFMRCSGVSGTEIMSKLLKIFTLDPRIYLRYIVDRGYDFDSHVKGIQLFIDEGADANERWSNIPKENILFGAIFNCGSRFTDKCIKILLNAGSNPCAIIDENGESIIEFASIFCGFKGPMYMHKFYDARAVYYGGVLVADITPNTVKMLIEADF